MAPGLPCISRCRRSHHVTETAPAGGGFLLAASHSSCCTALGTGIAPTGSPSPWRWCRRYLLIDDVHRSSQLGCCCRCHGGPWRYRQLHVQARQGHCRRPTRSNAHQLSCCTTEHFGSLIACLSNQQNPAHAGFFMASKGPIGRCAGWHQEVILDGLGFLAAAQHLNNRDGVFNGCAWGLRQHDALLVIADHPGGGIKVGS